MKKFVFAVLVAVVMISFSSCSKDDDGGNKKDCFNCSMEGQTIKFCHTEGDDFYTMSAGGQSQEIPLDGDNWEETKDFLQELCE